MLDDIEPVEGYLNGEIPDDALNNSRVVGSSNAPVDPEEEPAVSDEPVKTLAEQAKERRKARLAAERQSTGKTRAQEAVEEAAAANAAAVDHTAAPADDGFDPGDHNVVDVVAYLDEHPDEFEAVVELEKNGKARAGVLSHTKG